MFHLLWINPVKVTILLQKLIILKYLESIENDINYWIIFRCNLEKNSNMLICPQFFFFCISKMNSRFKLRDE